MSDLKKQLEIIKQGIEEIIGEDDLVQKLKDNKTLMRCQLGDDPWDGYHPDDTSLGNRLYHWEQAQLLYGAEYVLSFEKKYYPESEFLNFPNSKIENDSSNDKILQNLQYQR